MKNTLNYAPKILIANRGEIAIRIARTARLMGYSTVAVYSDADEQSEHLEFCDEAYPLGGIESRDSYLVIDKILKIARTSGANGIHPGYGFLSERPEFARAVEEAGLKFIGPTAESMEVMGDKIKARETVDRLKVPRVPGSPGAVTSVSEAKSVAKEIGYPVLLKAAAGGGGKGMRLVQSDSEISSQYDGAKREALAAFNDDAIYVEKFILSPHHIEVQVFGDGKGGAWHLGERECSVQRRHQKILEESPSPLMERHTAERERLFKESLKIVEKIKYRGAGTLEYVADEQGNFYFLEMNTRLQVEHPVTEWVTGVDLVRWQIELAYGAWKKPKNNPVVRGASVEARIYAEDPESFLPAPGPFESVIWPMGPGVRVDSAYHRAGEVARFYDPMIAKMSVYGATREEAIARLSLALSETAIVPTQGSSLRTNVRFLRRLLANNRVMSGDTPTSLIADAPDLTADVSAPGSIVPQGFAVQVIVGDPSRDATTLGSNPKTQRRMYTWGGPHGTSREGA